jgi:hypothetical protein
MPTTLSGNAATVQLVSDAECWSATLGTGAIRR